MHITMFYVGSAMTLTGAVGLLVLFRWFGLRWVLRQCRSVFLLHRKRRTGVGSEGREMAGVRLSGSACARARPVPDPVRMTQLLPVESGGSAYE